MTECPTIDLLIAGTVPSAFHDTKYPSDIFARSYFVSSAERGSTSQDFDRFAKVSLNSAKPSRFLRSDFYCPTWLKNWCVRLNPRAHFTRYRSEPIDVPGIFIHVVCNALFFYNRRPTAVQASPAVVFFYPQHCLSGRLSAQYAQRSIALRVTWSVRHSKSGDGDDPTRALSFWNLL